MMKYLILSALLALALAHPFKKTHPKNNEDSEQEGSNDSGLVLSQDEEGRVSRGAGIPEEIFEDIPGQKKVVYVTNVFPNAAPGGGIIGGVGDIGDAEDSQGGGIWNYIVQNSGGLIGTVLNSVVGGAGLGIGLGVGASLG